MERELEGQLKELANREISEKAKGILMKPQSVAENRVYAQLRRRRRSSIRRSPVETSMELDPPSVTLLRATMAGN